MIQVIVYNRFTMALGCVPDAQEVFQIPPQLALPQKNFRKDCDSFLFHPNGLRWT